MACNTYQKPTECPGLSPAKREFEKEKQKHSLYLNNGTLVAHNDLLAFTIEKPMGGFLEWHIITFNQVRILEELQMVRGMYPNDKQGTCPTKKVDLNYKKREFEQEKQKNKPFINLGVLTADDDLLAFDIEKPMGGFAEWHIITYNQIKVLEELREILVRIEKLGGYVKVGELIQSTTDNKVYMKPYQPVC